MYLTMAAVFVAQATIPAAGLTLIPGIDHFMSATRALTNLVGNGMATVVISRWENELDMT